MERIENINRDRIAWCCDDYGTTPAALADELGISISTMEKFMAGELGLTFGQLSAVAKHFGRGVLFFMEEGPVDAGRIHTPQFRTLANQKPELTAPFRRLIERAERQREVYLSLLEELDEEDRPVFTPPELPGGDPRRAAALVRKWLGLGDKNSFDSYRRAVEARGVLVFRSNGYAGDWQIPGESGVLGFMLYDTACPLIVVRKDAETRQAFTLAHELGHLLLHRSSSIDGWEDMESDAGQERAANAFAGHLLVPDAFLAEIRDADHPGEESAFDEWLEPQRKSWGVSTEVILRRLMDAGRLERAEYTAYRRWRERQVFKPSDGGSREYRHREPVHVFGDGYVRTVLDALNARRITLVRASRYLDNLKIKDLRALENFCARS